MNERKRLEPIDPYGLDWQWDFNQPIRKLPLRNGLSNPYEQSLLRKIWATLRSGTTISDFLAQNADNEQAALSVLQFGVLNGDLAVGDYIDKRFGKAMQVDSTCAYGVVP